MQRVTASIAVLFCFVLLVVPQDSPQPPDRVPTDAMHLLTLKRVNPIYPPLARQARIQGTVILNIVINKSGDVQSLQLVRGHPMLAPAAIDAVRQWKYQPYQLSGEPVDTQTTVQVIFKLAERPSAN